MAEPPVVNASPLIVLAQGDYLELLRVVGDRILVPRQVEREVLRPGIADASVQALRSLAWLEAVDVGPTPTAVRRHHLDLGEEAVLTWALNHPGTAAIVDDRRGRMVAVRIGVPVIGTLGMLIDAKLRGVIPAVRPVAEHLLAVTDWYLSPVVLGALIDFYLRMRV